MTKPNSAQRTATLFVVLAVAAALSVLAYSLWLAQEFGLTSLFADQWRIFDGYLSSSFPLGLLLDQNGHRPVFPNLIHYTNTLVLHQSQTTVMWFGFGLALCSSFFLVGIICRNTALDTAQKLVLSSLALLAMLAIGNATILFHPNESVHSYLVLLPLFIGLWLISAESSVKQDQDVATAEADSPQLLLLLLGTLATFSFGAGGVVFPTFLVMAVVLHKSFPYLLKLAASSAVAISVYLVVLPTAERKNPIVSHYVDADYLNVEWVLSVLKWISAPISYMYANSSIVKWLGYDIVTNVDTPVHQWIGPALALLILLYLSTLALRSLLGQRHLSRLENVYLGIAVGMIAVGVLVGFTRRALWHELPSNVFDPRYFVWSSLIWLSAISLIYLRFRQSSKGAVSALGLLLPGLYIFVVLGGNFSASSHADLVAGKDASRATALRATLDVYPSHYWTWIGVVEREQIAFVGEQFRTIGAPILSKSIDEMIGSTIEASKFRKADSMGIVTSVPLKNGTQKNRYVEVNAKLPLADPTIFVLDEDSVVKGLLLKEPVYRNPILALVGGGADEHDYHGIVSKYNRKNCYFYAIPEAGGKYLRGPIYLNNPRHDSDCKP
ncbi:MAG: hypothetical protein ACI9JM_000861 [Halioglobus sp.]|jgi:hypothetical protein